MATGWGWRASVFLDDKYCLVINPVFLSSLEQIVVFPQVNCPLSELRRKVPGTVLISTNLQAQRQELHHPAFIDIQNNGLSGA
jgi:hypothetical protein